MSCPVDVRRATHGTVLGLKCTGSARSPTGETLAEIVPLGEGLMVTAARFPTDIESVEYRSDG